MRVVRVAHKLDTSRGMRTNRKETIEHYRAMLNALEYVDKLTARGELSLEHAQLWPDADFAADCEALHRLLFAAVLATDQAEALPTRGRKHALDTAARLLLLACAHAETVPTVEMLRSVCEPAGIFVEDRRLEQVLSTVVNENKSTERPPT